MSVRIGDSAPPFSLPRKPGEVVDLSKHIGHEPVVLLFFPLAFSSVCTAEMCHLRDTWAQWQGAGVSIFGVSVDSPFVTDRFREAEGIPFPILSDFNKSVSATYGVLHEDLMGLKGVSKRSAFVIGKDGRVTYAWITDDPRNQVPFDEVMAAVRSTGARG